MSLRTTCPVSGSTKITPVFALGNVPIICNQLWPNAQEAAAAPAGNVTLVRSDECGMIWNAAFEPERMVYAPGYENALHFSPKFQTFAEGLAQGLVERFDLRGRHVFEIGCGDGHMLDLMVKHGASTATGFDPSMEGIDSPFTMREGVEIVPEYFRSDQLDRPFDAIMCRHVLEHLDAPMALLHDIRRAIGDRDVPVYFEVPNADWMLRAVSMWDVIYEHVGYWTAPAMETAFRRAGFEPVSIREGYDGQFLMLEARPSEAEHDAIASGVEAVASAADAFAAAVEAEISRLGTMLGSHDGSAVIWGAGSKGITFANVLGADTAPLAALVDLNPRKHGLYAPGAALPVVSPDALCDLDPSLVLISNALYEAEISSQLTGLGLSPTIAVIAG